MPTYEYACDSCHVIFQTRHGMNEKGLSTCTQCNSALRKVISAPRLNVKNFNGPTEAKYANMTVKEELVKERELQKVYQTIWIPPEVKHSPWDDHHSH